MLLPWPPQPFELPGQSTHQPRLTRQPRIKPPPLCGSPCPFKADPAYWASMRKDQLLTSNFGLPVASGFMGPPEAPVSSTSPISAVGRSVGMYICLYIYIYILARATQMCLAHSSLLHGSSAHRFSTYFLFLISFHLKPVESFWKSSICVHIRKTHGTKLPANQPGPIPQANDIPVQPQNFPFQVSWHIDSNGLVTYMVLKGSFSTAGPRRTFYSGGLKESTLNGRS